MKLKKTLILDDEFIEFCKLNDITDIDKKAKETFSRGFTLLKYGEVPSSKKTVETIEVPVEVEKIIEIEKIVEVQVEVIKEVRVEVPVQGKTKTITKEIIKEVPIDRIVEVVNDKQLKKLEEENKTLKAELDKITEALGKINKAKFMKNSDMSSLYDE
jgi:hypothetical protein